MRKSAFTLLELLMVVIILATLAGLSLLYGVRPIESGKARAARAVLEAIYTAEREHCIHHGGYENLGVRGAPGLLVTNGYLDDPNDPDQRDWDYTTIGIASGGPNDCGTFTAEATRRTGPNNGEVISIDQNGTFAGDFDPST